MADHRALQALKTLRDIIVAAATAAEGNVKLARQTSVFEQDAIDINPGPDFPPNEFGVEDQIDIDSIQRAWVDLHVRTLDDEEATLERVFLLRSEVHAAIMADDRLGIPSVVLAVRYGGTDEFEGEPAGDRLGSMRTIWDISYRMDYADPAT